MTARGLISVGRRAYNFAGGLISGPDPQPPSGSPPWYSAPVTVRKVDENSTATSVTNTASETTIATMTLPALTLSSTGAARLSAVGTIKSSTTVGNFTLRVKVADDSSTSTVLASSGISFSTSTSLRAWTMESWLLGKQPNINRAWGVLDISQPGAGASLLPTTFSAFGFSTLGLDETETWTVSITAQMSAASTALAITREVSILEGIN